MTVFFDVVQINQISELGWGVVSALTAGVSPAALNLSLIVWSLGVSANQIVRDVVGRYEAIVFFGDN